MQSQDITRSPGTHALFMVFGVNKGKKAAEQIKDFCADFAVIPKSMRGRFPDQEVSCIMAFGAEAWKRLFPKCSRPRELEPFTAIRGKKYTAPSTPGDLLFHIRSKRLDVCQEMAAIIANALCEAVTCIDEVQGFRYFDGRAIVGFVDGTENPDPADEFASATVGDEDPEFKGGSYIFVQKYLHDMKAWNALPVEEQEKAIGRRKFNDIELSDEEKPENAHNAVTNISDENGNELKIVRRNMPFANPARNEFGTYFIGYANTFTTTRKMLENMYIGEPEGNTDRLLDFSTAVTGTLFFAPTLDMLEDLAK